MRQRNEELESLGLQVLVVTFENESVARAYARDTDLPWPLLVDPTRSLYQAFAMDHGRWTKILGLSSWWAYARLLLGGRRLRRATGDVRQLGGDVLIDPTGTVRIHHIGRGPSDRPEVNSLLDVVRSKSTAHPK